jgi:hypothetical protein
VQVSQLAQDAEGALRPTEKLDLKRLIRSFTIRTREGFAENFGLGLKDPHQHERALWQTLRTSAGR